MLPIAIFAVVVATVLAARLRWWAALPPVLVFGWATVSTLVETDGGANFAFVTAFMLAIPYAIVVLAVPRLTRRPVVAP